MLIYLLLYTQFKININYSRIECLLIVFSLLNGPVDSWHSAATELSGSKASFIRSGFICLTFATNSITHYL